MLRKLLEQLAIIVGPGCDPADSRLQNLPHIFNYRRRREMQGASEAFIMYRIMSDRFTLSQRERDPLFFSSCGPRAVTSIVLEAIAASSLDCVMRIV